VLADAPLTEVTVKAIAAIAIAANTLGTLLMQRGTKATITPHLG